MSRTIAWAVLIVALALPAYAAPASKTSTGPFEFIEFSTTPTTGGVGLPRMNEICQTDFERTDARMATTKEYIESTNTAVPLMIAWINPVIIGGPDTGTVLEFSGRILLGKDVNCNGAWRDEPTGTGMVVDVNGGITNDSCAQSHLVACSARGQ